MTIIPSKTAVCCNVPVRFTIWLMIFLSVFFLYVIRSNFSINILAMIESTTVINGTLITVPDYGPRYPWNANDQGLLLGAYFWGYAITSIPIGVVTEKYGFAKTNIGYTFAISAVLMFLSPIAANSFAATLVLRFVLGFVSGGLVPAINKLISRWSPPNEKGKFMATLFGTDIGTVVTWSLCGVLIEQFGWEYAFYVPGVMAAVFTVCWYYLVYNIPETHPRISNEEKDYIKNSLTGINADVANWPPIYSILTSLPFWSLLLLHYGHIWGMYFLLTAAPKFMNEILGFNLSASGFLASLPSLVRLFTGILFGMLGDFMKSRNILSANIIRKGFCLFSHIIPGLFLIGIPYVGNKPIVCITFITLSYAVNGAVTLTDYANVHDIAPNYATTIFSIINAVATTSGIISPVVVAAFTKERNTIDEWSIIFMIGAGVYIIPAIFFILFGSVYIQKWNEPSTKSNKTIDFNISNQNL